MKSIHTVRAAIVVAAATVSFVMVPVVGAAATVETEPIVIPGASIPERDGATIADLGLFRWSLAEGFVPIPFQIDERVDHTFNVGTEYEFTYNVHDVFGEGSGTLDADDELVFLFSSAGEQAPTGETAPAGADGTRHEIEVADVTGEVATPRYVYLFSGTGLPASTEMLITWTGGASSSIETTAYAVDFDDPWLLTGYRVKSPCGDGADLIDRFKGRAGLSVNQSESEQVWNAISEYLGEIVGPVRALRYVRGAASAVNMIHYDVFYPDLWERQYQLRVHAVSDLWIYLDWLPGRVDTMYSPRQTTGVAIDGEPDSDPGAAVVPWELVRGPDGGMVTLYDVPPHPLVTNSLRYTRDDADFDDEPISSPFGYTDDDDVAIGNQGVQLEGIGETDFDAVIADLRFSPLCGGVGDAALGAAYSAQWMSPPTVTVTVQQGSVSPVRDLAVRREVDDVIVEWGAIAGASSYRVYSTDDPSLPIGSWSLEADGAATSFADSLAALDPGVRYYTVAVVDPGGGETF